MKNVIFTKMILHITKYYFFYQSVPLNIITCTLPEYSETQIEPSFIGMNLFQKFTICKITMSFSILVFFIKLLSSDSKHVFTLIHVYSFS